MRCRVCGEGELIEHPGQDRPDRWRRCLFCGSDSNELEYDYETYYAGGIPEAFAMTGGVTLPDRIELLRCNLEWFQDHRGGCPDNSFLDVGCAEGAALTGMADRGWSVHGFDVFEPSYRGPHVTVAPAFAPAFAASLFRQRFAAVLCREVIEHVPGWRAMVGELYAATAGGGLLQLQTPRPCATLESLIVYQPSHLQIIAPAVLRYWLERTGFDVIDYRLWPCGQAWICRRPG